MRRTLGGPPKTQAAIKPWALFVDDLFICSVTLEEAQEKLQGPYPTESSRLMNYARRRAHLLSKERKSAVMFTNTTHFQVFLPDGRVTGIGMGKRGKIIEAYNRNVQPKADATNQLVI